MPVEVRVPALMQRLTKGAKSIHGEGKNIGQLFDDLDIHYPGLKARVITDQGKLHPFINIYLNDEDIRFLGELKTPLSEGDVVSILPAIAGGYTNGNQVTW